MEKEDRVIVKNTRGLASVEKDDSLVLAQSTLPSSCMAIIENRGENTSTAALQPFQEDQLMCIAEFLINVTLNSDDITPLLEFANKYSYQIKNIEQLYKITTLLALRTKQYQIVFDHCNAFPYAIEDREMMKSIWIQAIYENAEQQLGKPLSDIDKLLLKIINPFPSTIKTDTYTVDLEKMPPKQRENYVLLMCYNNCKFPSDADKNTIKKYAKLDSVDKVEAFYEKKRFLENAVREMRREMNQPPKKRVKPNNFHIDDIMS